MDDNKALYKCSECGETFASPTNICGKCGQAVKAVCPKCGYLSSIGRHFCEKCGNLLPESAQGQEAAAPQTPKQHFKLEIQSLQDAADERGDSFRRELNAEHEEPQKAPIHYINPKSTVPRDLYQPPGEIPVENKPGEDKKEDNGKKQEDDKSSIKKIAVYIVVLAMIIGLGFTVYYTIIAPFIPRLKLTVAAKDYLTAFSQGNYEQAYQMLSSNSKLICPIEDYIFYNKQNFKTKREFRNIQVFSLTTPSAIVKYQLSESGGEWKDDYISFVFEHDRWVRPYSWTLYQPIEDALQREDYIQALFLAQKLYMTDPANPVSFGYLCSAEFHSGLYDKSVESCLNTLEAAATYPVGYPKEELNWMNIYYADSLKRQNRVRAAFDEYEKLHSIKDLTAEQQCAMSLNRADLYALQSNYEKAQKDIELAAKVCPNNRNGSRAVTLLRQLTGNAKEEAILFAQRSQLRSDLPIVEIIRREIVNDLVKKKKLSPKYAPKDVWTAEHINGPEYMVFLKSTTLNRATQKQETSDIFTVKVNLWNKSGKVEKPMELPAGLF